MQQVQPSIYFDNASTTRVNKEVLTSYQDLMTSYFENSDALYDRGVTLKKMMEKTRTAVADLFKVKSESIIFTSGASEANNMAIKGVAFAYQEKKHIISSSIEHSSVKNALIQLRDYFGYKITFLGVDSKGRISLEELKNSLTSDTILVSIMHVNNETGSINPIKEIGEIVKKNPGTFFHVDMVQSLSKLDIDLTDIDLASFSAHKIGGLKGSGFLMKKPHVKMVPLISGGQQEFNLRGGTSNTLVNILLYKTIRLALETSNKDYVKRLRDYLVSRLSEIDGILINSPENSVSNILNFSYKKIFSEVMLNALNNKGIMVSAQSTCASKSNNPSEVLLAMGYDNLRSNTCIRVSFTSDNTLEEIDYFIKSLKEIISIYGNL